jgi:hypothetical protein
MASTYSQNLKIELLGSGDQVGSWGATTNDNLGTTIEEAIVGYGAVQFTNDANLTISLSNSNASQLARNFFLYMTSTVTLTAQRDLIVPTIEKTYTVHNNTTGGQAIRVKTSAGTGIVVPNGAKMILYVDGTNVIEQMDYATTLTVGTLTINALNTPLAIASGGTGASSASGARTNLGLGTIATQDANAVAITGGSITGITDLAVADGGTGASTAAGARTNLGLGTIATQNSNAISITGGSITGITDLAIADGGTGASDAATARNNLGLGSMATQNSNAVSITGGNIIASTITAGDISGTNGVRGVTLVGNGFGLRVIASSGDTANILQFVNNAQTSQWASLVATNGNLNSTTNFSSSGSITASGGFVGNLTGNASTATNASTVTNGVYTTNFTGANQSLAVAGYQKLPGGLIIQWGTGTTNTAVALPIAFPNAFLNVVATGSGGGSGKTIRAAVANLGAVSIGSDFCCANIDITVYWLAIGY